MHARSLILAALALASGAAAEPTKRPAEGSSTRSAPVVLASADQVLASRVMPERSDSATVKRPRTARVTTCRCGDPQPEVQDEQ
jgi:hypothetical protein